MNNNVSPHQIWRLTGSYTPSPQEAGQALLEICQKDGLNVRDVRLLLEAGADLTLKNEFDRTALYNCAFMGHAQAIPLLIAAGADPNVYDLRHQHCIENAIVARQLDCVTALIDGGADIEAPCARGKTPLLMAVTYNLGEIAFAFLNAGADMDVKDWDGMTAIDIAHNRDHTILAARLEDFRQNEWQKIKMEKYCDQGLPMTGAATAIRKLKPKKPGLQP